MRTNSFLILRLFLIIMVIGSLSSCLKDDSAQKRADEEAKISSYISAQGITVTPSTSGLYTIIGTVGSGITPVIGNDVLINYELRTLNGSLTGTNDTTLAKTASINAENAIGGPFKTRVGASYSALTEALVSMREGGTSTFVIPSILWKNDYVPYVMKITLVKVLPSPREYELSQIYNFLDTAKANKALTKPLTIADSTTTGTTGVYYIEKTLGAGVAPSTGQTVTVKYTKRLIDGRKFDSGTVSFVLGAGTMIAGFDQGTKMMHNGGTATVVIPYGKAYGGTTKYNSNWQTVIPYYSTLIFDLELTAVQ